MKEATDLPDGKMYTEFVIQMVCFSWKWILFVVFLHFFIFWMSNTPLYVLDLFTQCAFRTKNRSFKCAFHTKYTHRFGNIQSHSSVLNSRSQSPIGEIRIELGKRIPSYMFFLSAKPVSVREGEFKATSHQH